MKIVEEILLAMVRYGYYDDGEFVYHREDGPSVICRNCDQFWFVNNNDITYKVNQWLIDHNIDDWKTMSDEDELALSFYMRSL